MFQLLLGTFLSGHLPLHEAWVSLDDLSVVSLRMLEQVQCLVALDTMHVNLREYMGLHREDILTGLLYREGEEV